MICLSFNKHSGRWQREIIAGVYRKGVMLGIGHIEILSSAVTEGGQVIVDLG
jgi:hypothetical protein